MNKYFNRKDFDAIQLKIRDSNAIKVNEAVVGRQNSYDVFISHSSKDKDIVKKIRQLLEDRYSLSAYIDWDEDSGMQRDEVASKVKEAMKISESLIFVKTSNSDTSQWAAWETGHYEAIKSADKIGVLLIEDDEFTVEAWKHREFLKDYCILEQEDIVPFVKYGTKKLFETKNEVNNFTKSFIGSSIAVDRVSGNLKYVDVGRGDMPTKFYGK
jgi:hypothetical protein